MRLPHHPALWSSAFVLWFCVTWWLSSEPREFPEGLQFRSSDKILHFGWYFGAAGLFSAFLPAWNPGFPPARRHLVAVLVLALCGIIDEIHQSTVPGRDATIGDFLADTLGALAGTLTFTWFRRRFPAFLGDSKS